MLHFVYFKVVWLAVYEVAYSFAGGGHHLFEFCSFVYGERETGQRNEHIACTALEPWIACEHICFAILTVGELVGCVYQTVLEVIAGSTLIHLLFEEFFQSACLYLFCACCEDNALSLLYLHFEVSGNVEVLVEVVSSLLFFGVFQSTIPIGLEFKLVLLVELHIEVGVTGVHTGLDTVVHLLVIAVYVQILVCVLAYAAECEERTESQCGRRVCVHQCVSYEYAVFVVLEKCLFLQNNASHPVPCGGHFVALVFSNVLVTSGGEVVSLIFVKPQVELCTMLYYCCIERREQYVILVVNLRNGDNKQSVILSCITVYNGCTMVSSRPVGSQNLFRQRLF